MTNKVRQYFAVYQLFYGTLAAFYDTYFLIDATHSGLQRALMILFLMVYAIVVLIAGYYAWKNHAFWFPLTLAVQALQLHPIVTQNLYLSFRCGISVDFLPATGDFNTNLLDLNSALSWRETPAFYAGLNVFAFLLCLLLLATRINQKRLAAA
jgi:hypothetical protein